MVQSGSRAARHFADQVPGGSTGLLERPDPAQLTVVDRPWQVIVWNDPVNLMSYVSYVFRSYFGFTGRRRTG